MKTLHLNPYKFQRTSTQLGYSIVELTISLAIISVIVVGSLAGVRKVLRTNQINNELKNISTTTANVLVATSTVANIGGLTLADLARANVFRASTLRTTTTTSGSGPSATTTTTYDGLTNNFGGTSLIKPNDAAIGPYAEKTAWMYIVNGVPGDSCNDFLSGLDNLGTVIKVVQAPTSPPTTIAGFNKDVKTATTPMSLATIGNACNTGASGQSLAANVSVLLVFPSR